MVDLNYTQLPPFAAALDVLDIVSMVDVSDDTDNINGSQFKLTMGTLRSFIGGRFADGTVANPGAYFLNETGLGLYRPAAGIVGFAQGGTQRGGFSADGVFGGTGTTGAGLLTINGHMFVDALDAGLVRVAPDVTGLRAGGNDILQVTPLATNFYDSQGVQVASVRSTADGPDQAVIRLESHQGLAYILSNRIFGQDYDLQLGAAGAGTVAIGGGGDTGTTSVHAYFGAGVDPGSISNSWRLYGGASGVRARMDLAPGANAGSQFDVLTGLDHLFTVNNVALLTIGATGVVSAVDVTAPNLIDGDADSDGSIYGRQNGAWVVVPSGGGALNPGTPFVVGELTQVSAADEIVSSGLTAGTVTTHIADTDIHFSDAPNNANQYARSGGAWAIVDQGVETFEGRSGPVVAQEADYEAFYLKPEMKAYSITTNAQAISGATVNIDVTATGQAQNLDMTAQVTTLNFNTPPGAATAYAPVVAHIRNGTGGALNFPTIGNGQWGDATPPTTIAAGTRTAFTLHTIDDGANWLLALIGEGYPA